MEKAHHCLAVYFYYDSTSLLKKNTFGFKFYNKVITHELLVKDIKKTKGLYVIDSEIHEFVSSDFNSNLFLEFADNQCHFLFKSRIKGLKKVIISFDKYTLNVFPFICSLKNNKKVEISYNNGDIKINELKNKNIKKIKI